MAGTASLSCTLLAVLSLAVLWPSSLVAEEVCDSEGTCAKSTGPGTEDGQPLKGLPASNEAVEAEGMATSLADQMGPMVINEDGTMKRIANWQEMTEAERKNTLRVIGKRNQKRVENLKRIREEMLTMATDAGIIPDVIADLDTPLRFTKVSYKATDPRQPWIELTNGLELTPALAREEPVVSWPAPAAGSADADSSFMTVIMLDPDAPSRENPKFRNWLHWLVVDIENAGADERSVGLEQPKDEHNGKEVASYKGPTPPPKSGVHRYIFLLFRHTARLLPAVDPALEQQRGGFDLAAFAATHALGDPSAVAYFTCQSA